ncbi:MAG: Bug family tripartite tricarboxylate transporter substrate binding protein [Burkholderiaceae bacterium]
MPASNPLLPRRAAAALLLATLALPAALQAQTAHNTAASANKQPIKLLIGYAPGGPVDAAARLFAPYFAQALGQTVLVDNKPGAGGVLAGDAVAKSAPNGTTLFFAGSPTMTISPHILGTLPFDPAKDLVPIAPILSYANVLVVNKDLPFRSVPALVAYAKAHPGQLSYGSAGIGSSNHLSGELFAARTGTQLTHVPYKGNAPAMTDVIGGQISMMFDIIGSARNYIASGRVRPLAVTSRERNASLPQVPSMQEAGIADYDVGGWIGLYGPAKMPAELVARYSEAARRALAQDELRRKLVEQGYDVWSGSAQALAERAARDFRLWGSVAKGIHVQP